MQFAVHPSSSRVAVITLDAQVFGGPQAVELASKVDEFAEQGGRWVVVNLGNVELMNSSGLGMLVSNMTSMRKFNGSVKLAAVPEKVSGLLRITRLDTVFECYATTEEAVQSCNE